MGIDLGLFFGIPPERGITHETRLIHILAFFVGLGSD